MKTANSILFFILIVMSIFIIADIAKTFFIKKDESNNEESLYDFKIKNVKYKIR